MSPITHQIAIDGGALTVYEWGQPHPDRPSLIFLHATSFHGRCWDAVIRLLPEFHAYAVDARGHGQSVKSPPPFSWQQNGADMAAVVRALGLQGAMGIGHSMGGNGLVRAAAAVPSAFRGLVLVDPVILPIQRYTLEDYAIDGHFVLNRRRNWDSPDQMVARFLGRGPFAKWQPDVLRDYCQYGLLPSENGYMLACAPELEAHVYASTALKVNADVYDAVAKIAQPVMVLRCATPAAEIGVDLMASPTAPDLAAHFQRGRDLPLADYSHFIPMEAPELVAAQVRAMVAQLGD